MLPRSLFSRFVLVGISSASLAGWLGVRAGVDAGPLPAAASIVSPLGAQMAVAPAAFGVVEIPGAVDLAPVAGLAGAANPSSGVTSTSPASTGAQPGVRDRAAWAPSPIPSQSKLATVPATPPTAQVAQGVAPTPAASQAQVQSSAARNRAAWQPSPIPSKPAATGTGIGVSTSPTLAGTTGVQNVAEPADGLSAQPVGLGAGTANLAGGNGPDVAPTENSALPNLPALAPAGPAPAVAALPGLGAAIAPVAPGVPAAPAVNPANPAREASAPVAAAAAKSDAAAAAARVPSSAPADAVAGLSYTPLSSMFTTDKLEARFNGELPAKRGEWVEQHFYSQALGREDSYLVWLPPDYNANAKRYPSLYLLHGVGGPDGYGVEEWLGYALTEDLDRMLTLGMIEPMIVVLPNGEQGYWMNHSPDTDGTRWADFVALDLVKDVDAHFRTEPVRERRAIGGLSMGGHGALQIALNHPNLFGIVGAHSPTLRPFETSPEFFGDEAWFARYDPLSLAEKTDAARLAIWIDVGYEDEWRPAAEQLDQILAAKKAPVQFHVLEGEHDGWYWEYYLPEYLNFYSSALTATAKTPKGAPVVDSRSILASSVVVSQANT